MPCTSSHEYDEYFICLLTHQHRQPYYTLCHDVYYHLMSYLNESKPKPLPVNLIYAGSMGLFISRNFKEYKIFFNNTAKRFYLVTFETKREMQYELTPILISHYNDINRFLDLKMCKDARNYMWTFIYPPHIINILDPFK